MRPLVKKTPEELEQEFEEAINAHIQELRKYCLSLTKSKWDGEDLMQDTLSKAYIGWLNRPKPITKAYLFRIASNTRIDGYRKRKPSEDMNKDLTEFKQKDDSPSDMVYRAIEVLIGELSPKQRLSMLLVEGLGLTTRETAKMISETEGSVKASLHRARNKVKQIKQDSWISSLEEDETLPYVMGLRNGDPLTFVQLYQREIQQPLMSAKSYRTELHPQSLLQTISGTGSSYVLVSIITINGDTLFIPFYQLELLTILSQVEGLRKELPLAM
ncbi:RNA polymerase sigma factor [Halobacillus shinanisalinarum]|uniref:RNA polymerase sigma factor n=1 Tax=Halobacillus shinanisalinarum TaxID=2932258 RepID=A0ABY4GZV1_9BACI|nr:RNA polymerase sigma factor [Halobacillus shinanisalinarum]UOQ93471.1 RNA polymerase sigma factor [Halobacillus shinanisalinarum]